MAGALSMPNVTAYLLDHTKAHERPMALAMRNMGQDIGE